MPHVVPVGSMTGAAGGSPRRKLSSAGRLLDDLLSSGSLESDAITGGLGVDAAVLEACRRGAAQLSLEQQMRLAALALLLAPQHGRRARALYAQAQAALRMQVGEVSGHMTYPKEQFR